MPKPPREDVEDRAPAATDGAGRTLHDLFDALKDHGGDPAILTPEADGLKGLSYEALWGAICALTSEIIGRGTGRSDRVAIIGRNGAAWVIACLSAVNAGAIAVPVDASLDDETLRHVLSDAAPGLVFADEEQQERIGRLAGSDVEIRDMPASPGRGAPAARPAVGPGDTALLFYTSGTTGPPKGVPLTHANLVFELDRLIGMRLVARGERLLLPLPMHHAYPFVVGLLTSLSYGVGVVFPRSLTGPDMQAAMRDGGVNTVLGVPRLYDTLVDGIDRRAAESGRIARTLYDALVRVCVFSHRRLSVPAGRVLMAPLRRRVAPALRLLVSGGAALDEDLAWRLDSLGWTVATGYGLTETAPILTVLPPGDTHFASAGKPVRGVDLRIVPDTENGGTANGGTGEIQVRGPNVFSGYRNLGERSRDAFTEDGWYRTSDRGRLDDEGYLHVLGRSSLFVVTEAGENISLEELEQTYARHPVIREIGVFMRDGRLSAVAVPDKAELRRQGAGAAKEAVEAAVRQRGRDLPRYKRILDVAVSGEALSRTTLGKLRRDRLEDRFEARRAGRADDQAGPMPVEDMAEEDRALLGDPAAREVWDLLARRFETLRLTPDSSVAVDLGVDSLEWINLTLDIRDRTGVELTEAETARIETVRDLLGAVHEATGEGREGGAHVTEDPHAYLSENERRWLRPLGRVERVMARVAYRINRGLMRLFFRLEVEGLDNLPSDAQVVILPNHTSYLDGFVIMAALPFDLLRRTVIAGSADRAFATPLHRFAMRLARALPIRTDRAALSSLALPLVKLDEGANLIWFPEGRRTPDGDLLPVRPGIGVLLGEHPVTVVPALIEGAFEAMPIGTTIPKLRRVRVHFGRPVATADLAREGRGETEQERIVHGIGAQLAALKSSAGG